MSLDDESVSSAQAWLPASSAHVSARARLRALCKGTQFHIRKGISSASERRKKSARKILHSMIGRSFARRCKRCSVLPLTTEHAYRISVGMLLRLAVRNLCSSSAWSSSCPRVQRPDGETGAGKSMLIDALALVLGGRARPDMVRAGQQGGRGRGAVRDRARFADRCAARGRRVCPASESCWCVARSRRRGAVAPSSTTGWSPPGSSPR